MADFSVRSTGLSDVNAGVAFSPTQGVRELGKEALVSNLGKLGKPVVEGYALASAEEEINKVNAAFFGTEEEVSGNNGLTDRDRETVGQVREQVERLQRGTGDPYRARARYQTILAKNIAMHPHLSREFKALGDDTQLMLSLSERAISEEETYRKNAFSLGYDVDTPEGAQGMAEYQAATARFNTFKYATGDVQAAMVSMNPQDFDTITSGVAHNKFLKQLPEMGQEERLQALDTVNNSLSDLVPEVKSALVAHLTPIFGEEKARRGVAGLSKEELDQYVVPFKIRLEHVRDRLKGKTESDMSNNMLSTINKSVFIKLHEEYPEVAAILALERQIPQSTVLASSLKNAMNNSPRAMEEFIGLFNKDNLTAEEMATLSSWGTQLQGAAKLNKDNPEVINGSYKIFDKINRTVTNNKGRVQIGVLDDLLKGPMNIELMDTYKKGNLAEYRRYAITTRDAIDLAVTNKLIPDMLTKLDEFDGGYEVSLDNGGGVVVTPHDSDDADLANEFNRAFTKRTSEVSLAHSNLSGSNFVTKGKEISSEIFSRVLGTKDESFINKAKRQLTEPVGGQLFDKRNMGEIVTSRESVQEPEPTTEATVSPRQQQGFTPDEEFLIREFARIREGRNAQ